MRTRQGIFLSAGMLVSLVSLCRAQSVTLEDEYKQRIKIDRDIQPLGAHPLGESIGLYDGTLSFEQIDISVPGQWPQAAAGARADASARTRLCAGRAAPLR